MLNSMIIGGKKTIKPAKTSGPLGTKKKGSHHDGKPREGCKSKVQYIDDMK